jgi:uncharacterized membrane protein
MQVPNHVQDHIDTIAKHEQEFLARRSPAERLGDLTAAIVANLGFVAAHLFLFLSWILANTLHLPSIPHFDPVPFSLLGTIVAMEAILLASLILMRQARLARRADEREHLMLQILLLTENEVTAVISMNQQIATRWGCRIWKTARKSNNSAGIHRSMKSRRTYNGVCPKICSLAARLRTASVGSRGI